MNIKRILVIPIMAVVLIVAATISYSHISGNINKDSYETNAEISVKSSFKNQVEPISVSASMIGDEIDWLNDSDLIVRLKLTNLDFTDYLEDSYFGQLEYKIYSAKVLETFKGKCPKDIKIRISQLAFITQNTVSDIILGREYILHLNKTPEEYGDNTYYINTSKEYVYELIEDSNNKNEKVFMRESTENPHYSDLGLKEKLTLKEYKKVIKSIIEKDRGTSEQLEKEFGQRKKDKD